MNYGTIEHLEQTTYSLKEEADNLQARMLNRPRNWWVSSDLFCMQYACALFYFKRTYTNNSGIIWSRVRKLTFSKDEYGTLEDMIKILLPLSAVKITYWLCLLVYEKRSKIIKEFDPSLIHS